MATKIVEFEKYCNRCRFRETYEGDDPCNECLSEPVNDDSRKPVRFWPKVAEGNTNEK